MSLSCFKASELASRKMEENLSKREKLAFVWHVLLCAFCNQFRKQIQFVSRLFKSEELLASTGSGLEPEARERIRKNLKAKGCNFSN